MEIIKFVFCIPVAVLYFPIAHTNHPSRDRFLTSTDYDKWLLPMPILQHTRGWSHNVTKNVLNTNNMTDIVNDVLRCT